MHHPQPQHPPSSRRYLHAQLPDVYSAYHTATSNVRSSKPFPTGQEQLVHIVEPPQYNMSVHPPMPPPADPRTPETCHEFQMSPTRNSAAPPIFALRPVNAPMAFSHIEYPNISSTRTQPSETYAPKPQEPVATTYNDPQPRDQAYSAQQASYELSGMEQGSPERQASRPQPYYDSPERPQGTYGYSYATQPMERMETVKPVMRRRARGDSNSSVASMWSSAAVSGDAAYRNDMLRDEANRGHYGARRGSLPPSGTFQPQSAQATYSYEYAPVVRDGTLPCALGSVDQGGEFPASPAMQIDSPHIPPPVPRSSGMELQNPVHPFVSGNMDWDIPFSAPSAASTDGDTASLHSQDQSSSRSSSEPAGGPTGRSKRGRKDEIKANLTTHEKRAGSGEGKKKTVMACHFCRFRKLRCDGGRPCGHCIHRERECTYDATVRRRGPGRKNKSAQETARVQLANRQREEAEREVAAQTSATKDQGQVNQSKAMKEGLVFKDAWSQTSPQSKRHISASRVDFSAYSPDAHPQYQLRTPQGSSPRVQEYQAFSLPFGQSQEQDPEASRYAREWKEHDMPPMPPARSQRVEEHRRAVSGPLPYGLQTPVTQAPSSFYEGSPDRYSSQQHQYASSNYGYSSNRYSIATQGGETTYSHTDSESAYAYSEGANVLPSEYTYERYPPEGRQQQRSDMQTTHFRRVTTTGVPPYVDEINANAGDRMDTSNDGYARMGRREMRR